jgi:hypothetical protein
MKKTTRYTLLRSFLFLALSGAVISGCKKTPAPQPANDTNETTTSNENGFAQTSFNDVGSISDQAAAGSMSSYRETPNNGGLLSSCATITADTVHHTFSVDFGPTNCLCKDGRWRRGKIFVSYTKPHYWDSLDVITIGFANYAVNDYGINGTKTISNLGRVNGQQTYNVSVTNGQITKPNNGGSYTWNSNWTRKWIAGENTPWYWLDDQYSYTGNSNGMGSNGIGYSTQTITPLVHAVSCPDWFVSGQMSYTPSGRATRTLDFGSGACDATATVTVNGQTSTFHMW